MSYDRVKDVLETGLYRPRARLVGLGGYGFGEDELGDWLSDLSSQLPNPADAQQRAEQLGAQFTNWAQTQESAIKKDAFKYFYLQGRDLLGKMSFDPRIGEFKKQASALYDSAVGGYDVLKRLSASDYSLDTSGIIDTAMAGQAMITALGSFAKYAGANAQVIDTFGGWATVGLGCIAGLAATGVIGVIGCASSIMLKSMETPPMQWYSILADQSNWPCIGVAGGSGQPRAFLVETIENTAAIQADALRLASVLKYHYGIGSTTVLWESIVQNVAYGNDSFCGWGAAGYPLRPPRDPQTGAFVQGAAKPVPATTLDDIAKIFSQSQNGGARQVGALGLPDRLFTTGQPFSEPLSWKRNVQVSNFVVSFNDTGDVSVSIAESLAAAGRANVGNNGTTTIHKAGYVPQPLYGWIVVDDLVNFFAAMTLRQVSDRLAQGAAPIQELYLGSGLPVQLSVVPDASTRWTLNATAVQNNAPALATAVAAGNVEACREFAGLRLMAALSHIIMMYKWADADLLASLPDYAVGDFRRAMMAPVDPRTVITQPGYEVRWDYATQSWQVNTPAFFNTADGINDGQKSEGYLVGRWRDTPTGPHIGAWRGPVELASIIAGREAFFGPVKNAALAAAQTDQVPPLQMSVSPIFTSPVALPLTTGGMKQMVLEKAGPMMPLAQAQALWAAQAQAQAPAQSGGGGIGVALLAGAALLFAKFMK